MSTVSTPPIMGEGRLPIERGTMKAINHHSGDYIAGSLNEELIAAPSGAGRATYLTHVTMGLVKGSTYGVTVDATVSLVDGGGYTIIGPVQFQADGQTTFSKDFKYPLKVTDEKAVDISGACAAGAYQAACFVFVEYFTGDKPLG